MDTTRRDAGIRFILTTDDYKAAGVVLTRNGRHLGYDTGGRQVFDRKDFDGALAAAKGKGLRCVAPGYYGIDPYRPEEVSTAEHLRRKAAKDAAQKLATKQAEADREQWMPLGKVRATERAERDQREGYTGPRLGVIGEVGRSHTGNTCLRVGRMNEQGWEQTANVVLTPAERDYLLRELLAHAAVAPAPTETPALVTL